MEIEEWSVPTLQGDVIQINVHGWGEVPSMPYCS